MRVFQVRIALVGIAAAGMLLGAAKANRHRRPSFDAAAVSDTAQRPELAQGAQDAGVVRAQVLLARAHFSCGEIDGHFGDNLRKTVSAFQQERGLPLTGRVDGPTWQALSVDSAPILLPYTLSEDDVKGPFQKIPESMMERASLPALGFESPLEAISEKFHSSPRLMEALNPGKDFGKAGEQIVAPNVIVMAPPPAASVAVSKSESSVRAYDASGKLLAFYVASIGSEHDPLPLGRWKITGVKHNPDFHYDAHLFWDAKRPDEKATLPPGPNNPVGVVWIDLSKEHYGIHGAPDPATVGHSQSHGCIRLTNWDAMELASMVKPGTQAILRG